VAEVLLSPVHESRVATQAAREESNRSTVKRNPKPDLAFAVTVVRQARGMSKAKLADVIEMPRQWLQHVENGKKEPTIQSVRKLAKGLKVSPRTLICISEARRAA
jgi:ribosome-binding protein aMBF1 (putative translation factor)